ncbi:MAG: 2-hydroxyacid dehydrogenase, partial [Alcaligenaceae bacterium]|nr:2-hydroxyacid dehydrogenase [Alcaligenaceae bacterium]
VLTCPGGAATRHLINAAVLDAMGPDAWLINLSRGSVVDEDALIDALQRKSIGGAGLDVFENEPHIDTRFHELDNVLLYPHHASGTVETRSAMSQLVVDNLKAHFQGKPLVSPV